jgi:hypothetical protein
MMRSGNRHECVRGTFRARWSVIAFVVLQLDTKDSGGCIAGYQGSVYGKSAGKQGALYVLS